MEHPWSNCAWYGLVLVIYLLLLNVDVRGDWGQRTSDTVKYKPIEVDARPSLIWAKSPFPFMTHMISSLNYTTGRTSMGHQTTWAIPKRWPKWSEDSIFCDYPPAIKGGNWKSTSYRWFSQLLRWLPAFIEDFPLPGLITGGYVINCPIHHY